MYFFWNDIREFGDIFFDEEGFFIKFFRLEEGIKYPKWLRISAHRGRPLPVSEIDRFIVVYEIFLEKFLPPLPVYETVFGDKRRHNHTETVVHPVRCL